MKIYSGIIFITNSDFVTATLYYHFSIEVMNGFRLLTKTLKVEKRGRVSEGVENERIRQEILKIC